MSTNIGALTSTTDTASATSSGNQTTSPVNSATDVLSQKETFLKLLVAQIKNQNPLDPADGIEFLSQLAQFSQLEQMLAMRTELEAIRKGLEQKPAGEGATADPNSTKGA